MNPKLNTRVVFFGFMLILSMGTLGYHFIEGWDIFDSFYMTAITITTVGFSEVHPLSTAGRILTMIILFLGFGTAVLALSTLTTWLMQGELQQLLGRRRMQSDIKKMKGHFILAGFGRMGEIIAKQLIQKNIEFIVIDKEQPKLKQLEDHKIPYLIGDASDEFLLKEAGIERAKGFISVVSNDSDNAFAVMTAKGLNKNIRVVTRAIYYHSIPKLRLAGADKVIAPYHISATRIAQAVINPAVVDFVEVVEDANVRDIDMADVEILPGSSLDGCLLSSEAVRSLGIIVVGIKKKDGAFSFQPSGATKIEAHDHLVIVGPTHVVEQAATRAE